MDVFAPLFTINILGYKVGSAIVIEWGVMIFLIIVCSILARNLKKGIPTRLQATLEILYEGIESMVAGNMGKGYSGYIPFVGTLAIYLGILNLCGLIGFGPPTRNLSVVIGFTVITFVLVHYNSIKRKHIGGYLKGYAKPYLPMLPINIIEKVVFPVSLALRLFGNMLAAAIVMGLIYMGLGHISIFADMGLSMLPQIGLPIFAHAFFDLFDGCIQTVIFVMLTIITIKLEAETEEI
ncbi:F0F1 ATP synthase subunit A [uncultured Clostridium sp.]|jgi:F-type H+-transporting ATPase subunit a|uniref:F0F1 ATP synthase subunit A n=1 Tax=uncultured Clostridium sp. TaxID=59620 RepID=UPI0026270A0C|nr:F0F1 ATP synthase subunit A [uncultured Clostridium sp.]